jgi:hypothetical protein
MTLSPLPPPGWYPDPSSSRIYRWWDGQAWTQHTSVGQPVATEVPVAAAPAQVHATALRETGGGATAYAEAQFPAPVTSMPSPARPAQQATIGASIWQRNRYALITMGIVALYLFLAVESHIVMLGVWPILTSVRSWQRKEPVAGLAVLAAVAAVLFAILALTGR